MSSPEPLRLPADRRAAAAELARRVAAARLARSRFAPAAGMGRRAALGTAPGALVLNGERA